MQEPPRRRQDVAELHAPGNRPRIRALLKDPQVGPHAGRTIAVPNSPPSTASARPPSSKRQSATAGLQRARRSSDLRPTGPPYSIGVPVVGGIAWEQQSGPWSRHRPSACPAQGSHAVDAHPIVRQSRAAPSGPTGRTGWRKLEAARDGPSCAVGPSPAGPKPYVTGREAQPGPGYAVSHSASAARPS